MKSKITFLYLISLIFFFLATVYSQDTQEEVKVKSIDEIINDLKMAVTTSPEDTALYFLLGDAYIEKELPESAYSEYEKVWKMNPQNVKALVKMGSVLLQREDVDDAEEKLKSALAIEKGTEEACITRAFEHELNFRYKNAVKEYYKAIEKYKNLIEIYRSLGIISGKRENLEEGIGYYQNVLNYKDSVAKVYSSLGSVYRKSGNVNLSISMYKNAIDLKPDDEGLYYALGLSFSLIDSLLEDAVGSFEESIKIDSTNADIHYKLAMVYGRMGKLAHHIWELQKAVEIELGNSQARMDLAVAYYNNKQYLSSWEQLKEAEKLGYKVPEDFLEVLTKALPRPKD